MSMWLPDIDGSLIVRPRDRQGKSHRNREEVFCKLGRHSVDQGAPLVWLRSPIGQSCEPCVKRAGLMPPPPAPVVPVAKVPAQRKSRAVRPVPPPPPPGPPVYMGPPLREGQSRASYMSPRPLGPKAPARGRGPAPKDPSQWVHGKRSTYNNRGCRCEPCKEANRVRNNQFYAARMARRRGES